MDFGNLGDQTGAGFEEQPLALANLPWDQIASQLFDPTSVVAQAEDGSANYLTAGDLPMTGNRAAAIGLFRPLYKPSSEAQPPFGS